MARYINIEPIIERLKERSTDDYTRLMSEAFINLLEREPHIDLVKCEDCLYWEKQKDSLQGKCCLFGNYPTGKWFCANGRR